MMLNCPERTPKSGKKPNQLILFLHGVGASGDDLIDIASSLEEHFPDAHFISPNAPYAYDMAPFGHQWFSLKDTSEQALLKGLNNAMPHLNTFVDHQLNRFGLAEQNLAVIGFSQGSMVALHTFLRRPKPIALIVGLSGMVVAPHLLEKELQSKPYILLLHGEKDQILPVKHIRLASQTLKRLGLDIKTHIYPDLEHNINQEEIAETIQALKEKFLLA